MTDHPDFQFRPGSIVIRISLHEERASPECCVGQVVALKPSGRLECIWVDKERCECFPQELILVGDYDSDDLWDDSDTESVDDVDRIESTPNKDVSKDANLSELLSAVTELETWFERNETVNNRNAGEAVKLVMNIRKKISEVDGSFSEALSLSISDFTSLLETVLPPDSPSEIPWTRLTSRVKSFLTGGNCSAAGDTSAQTPSRQTESKCESPNSKKTSECLRVLRRFKSHLFPLCNKLSTSDQMEVDFPEPTTPVADVREDVVSSESFLVQESVPDSHRFKLTVHHPRNPKLFFSKLRQEIELLKSSLPADILVKTFDDRMDLFSVMIKGPKSTPYEDGLFFFDVQLPADYPTSPPVVHYISYCTDRLNPNLYENGKVCVSLLGTWVGKGSEVWFPGSSNLLQVLVSIQVSYN